jgi:methionine biosynthesis protein MetW
MEMLRQNISEQRKDFMVIADQIPDGSRMLDLGCGDGSLLKILAQEKNIKGLGVEGDQNKIIECIANGVPVIHADLNDKLPFKDNSFDYVILSHTLQTVKRPDLLLREMSRVGNMIVISFINFAFYKARIQLLLRGRMPVTETLPSTWFNTENIHLATILDFRDLCARLGLKIQHETPLGQGAELFARVWPNMFAQTCVFVLQSEVDCIENP